MLRNVFKSLEGINLSLGFILAMSAVFIAFEWESSESAFYVDEPTVMVLAYVAEDLPITYHEKKQLQTPPPKKAPIYDLEKILEEVQPDVHTKVELTDEADVAPKQEDIVIINIPNGIKEVDESMPVYGAEVMPAFPGGVRALQHYLRKHLKYPHLAQEYDIQGTVYVRFVVSKTGEVENVEIYRGVDASLDKEAIRVVESMPKWKPGSQRGRSVSVYFVLPIKFLLRN